MLKYAVISLISISNSYALGGRVYSKDDCIRAHMNDGLSHAEASEQCEWVAKLGQIVVAVCFVVVFAGYMLYRIKKLCETHGVVCRGGELLFVRRELLDGRNRVAVIAAQEP
ncbi:unnamed protein product [Bursaphelenchus xylophilus]|uniref:(pine wood nematode) hypothetical protein n=1 Tax=Bursaphelenchus xylophilus TaxID=6326 RepID=A0A1I7RMK8_BURXY|nr:unnamed protein product [Bursaphelenchus xylophilus]CAG9125728.1 unnamed protein product [Bursaphelenchus xylophilus]